jgi:CRP-like cAMP-binding protein
MAVVSSSGRGKSGAADPLLIQSNPDAEREAAIKRTARQLTALQSAVADLVAAVSVNAHGPLGVREMRATAAELAKLVAGAVPPGPVSSGGSGSVVEGVDLGRALRQTGELRRLVRGLQKEIERQQHALARAAFRAGLSDAEIAEVADVSRAAVGKWRKEFG